jgi:imidazoleglycerol-phosphate dehydratase
MLAEEGFEVFPSEANFLLVRTSPPEKAREIQERLEARSIRVRDVSGYPGLAGCIRVSVGTGAALRAVRRALRTATGVPFETSPPGPLSSGAGEGERGRSGVERGPGGEVSKGTPLRAAHIERTTSETRIRLDLRLEGGERRILVPSGFFGHMLQALATHGGLGLDVEAEGDTHIDLHHTVEDVGIAFGEALAIALGERRGIVRFAHAYAPLDEALARAVVDLSGRGSFHWSAPPEAAAAWVTPDFPLTLVADFFQAVADRGRLTLHLDVLGARNGHHAAEAAFKAAALALRQAVAFRAGAAGVPSTKGTLSA